ncbi:MAG: hypothetical protein O2899_00220, partial [Bacteroidetes bacterium]|nr:hypothetical protein [Bacteroidota bacterium]
MGGTLEAGDSAAVRKRRRRQLAVKVGLMLSLVVVTMVAFPRGTVYQYTVRMDEIWRQPNLHAPFTFAVNKPDAVVQAEREAVRRSTPLIFSREEAAAERVQAQAIQLRQHMDRILTHYGRFVLNTTSGRMEEALRDSIAFDASRDSMSLSLTRTEWEAILTSYVSQTSGRITSSRSELPGERLDRLVVREAESVVLSLMPDGIVNISRGAITSDSLIVRSDASREERLLASSSIRDVSLALEAGRDQLQQRFPGQAVTRQIAEAVFGQLLPPNLIFDQRQTQDRLARREAEILPTEGIVRENEVIVRQGDRVTPDIMRKIDSLQEQLILQSGNRVAWKTKMGHFLVTIATLMIFFLYLYLLRKPIFEDNAMITLITLLFLGVIAVFGVALRAALIDMYVVPVAIVAIVLTVIFDSRVAFFGSLTLALTGSHLLNYDFGFTFATVFASALGIFSVRDIRNRSQFFLSASVVFVGYMLVLTANLLLQGTPTDRFVDLTIFVAINSVLLLLADPALWIFERVFAGIVGHQPAIAQGTEHEGAGDVQSCAAGGQSGGNSGSVHRGQCLADASRRSLPRHRQDGQAGVLRREPARRCESARRAEAPHECPDHSQPRQGRHRHGAQKPVAQSRGRLHPDASRHDADRVLLSSGAQAAQRGRTGCPGIRIPVSGTPSEIQGDVHSDVGRWGGGSEPFPGQPESQTA